MIFPAIKPPWKVRDFPVRYVSLPEGTSVPPVRTASSNGTAVWCSSVMAQTWRGFTGPPFIHSTSWVTVVGVVLMWRVGLIIFWQKNPHGFQTHWACQKYFTTSEILQLISSLMARHWSFFPSAILGPWGTRQTIPGDTAISCHLSCGKLT